MANPQDQLDLRALQTQFAALTARVHQLEQRAGLAPPAFPAPSVQHVAPPPPPPPSTIVPGSDFLMKPIIPSGQDVNDLEGKIGKLWLNRIGIVAFLAAVAYFIKYAFDSGWIGPAGRVTMGLITGIAVILWSERFRQKNHAACSYSLKAIGVGTLYLSLWGAFQVNHLMGSDISFVAMIVVTPSPPTSSSTQHAHILPPPPLYAHLRTHH